MKIPKIGANVWYLSFVSLLNDTASEMLYPVMPIFITQVLGAPVLVFALFAVYGFYIALTDGVSKALVGSMVQKEQAGTVYGVMTTTTSIFTLAASIIGGLLWSAISPAATFIFAAFCAALSLFIFNFVRTK